MFGYRRRQQEIDARLSALEARLQAQESSFQERLQATESVLDRRLAEVLTRYEQHPDERVRFPLNSIAEELRVALARGLEEARQAGELKEAVAQIHREAATVAQQLAARARGEAALQGRVRAELNRVYHAEWTGYVSLFFTGGWTDRVHLLAGPVDPPQEVVCEINSRNDVNSYAGGVVRQGEYWLARSEKGKNSGVECVYTPFLQTGRLTHHSTCCTMVADWVSAATPGCTPP